MFVSVRVRSGKERGEVFSGRISQSSGDPLSKMLALVCPNEGCYTTAEPLLGNAGRSSFSLCPPKRLQMMRGQP